MTLLRTTVPGSAAWVVDRVDLRVEFHLRQLMRGLLEDVDALSAVLWTEDGTKPSTITVVGDDALRPRALPPLHSSVPSWTSAVDGVGEVHDAVVQRIVVGRGVARVGLLALDVRRHDPGVLAATARTALQVEQLLVHACSDSESRRRSPASRRGTP